MYTMCLHVLHYLTFNSMLLKCEFCQSAIIPLKSLYYVDLVDLPGYLSLVSSRFFPLAVALSMLFR